MYRPIRSIAHVTENLFEYVNHTQIYEKIRQSTFFIVGEELHSQPGFLGLQNAHVQVFVFECAVEIFHDLLTAPKLPSVFLAHRFKVVQFNSDSHFRNRSKGLSHFVNISGISKPKMKMIVL